MSTIATIEGIDLGDLGAPTGSQGYSIRYDRLQRQRLHSVLGEVEQPQRFNGLAGTSTVTSSYYTPSPERHIDMADPPEEQAKQATDAAQKHDKLLDDRRKVACVMKEQTTQALNEVKRLDAQVAAAPPGPGRDALLLKRRWWAVQALRGAKTHAVAVILARDAKRKANLHRAYATAARKGNKAEMLILGHSIQIVGAHEQKVQNVRKVQQATWACLNAPLKTGAAQHRLRVLQEQKVRLDRAAQTVAQKRKQLAAGRGVISAAESFRLDRWQANLDRSRKAILARIARAEQQVKTAARPCTNPRATMGLGFSLNLPSVPDVPDTADAVAHDAVQQHLSPETTVSATAALSPAPLAPAVSTKIRQAGKAAEKVDAAVAPKGKGSTSASHAAQRVHAARRGPPPPACRPGGCPKADAPNEAAPKKGGKGLLLAAGAAVAAGAVYFLH